MKVVGDHRGDHGTATDLAAKMASYAKSLEGVLGVSPGYLMVIHGRTGTTWVVKIINEGGCLLVICLQKASKQEIRVYTQNGARQAVLESLSRYVRNSGWELRFK